MEKLQKEIRDSIMKQHNFLVAELYRFGLECRDEGKEYEDEQKLKAENQKLREEITKLEDQIHFNDCRISGLEDMLHKDIELKESYKTLSEKYVRLSVKTNTLEVDNANLKARIEYLENPNEISMIKKGFDQ